jgi:hypothetical protein
VDVRTLANEQFTSDQNGPLFSVARAKTGETAVGMLSRAYPRRPAACCKTLPPKLLADVTDFLDAWWAAATQGWPAGARYIRTTHGRWFLAPCTRRTEPADDRRKLRGFPAMAVDRGGRGGTTPQQFAGRIANTVDRNKELQATCLPHHAAVVRPADQARMQGRARLRGGTTNERRPKI